jgi:predicted CXXCH cytochrome family protein
MLEPPRLLLRGLRVPLRLKVGTVLALAFVLLSAAFLGADRKVFLPGTTSDGHHVFEESCGSCHDPFRGVAADRCTGCHAPERGPDTHAAALFDDPRWAPTLARLDVRECVTCHGEHRRADGGVTAEPGFCFPCHDDVPAKRTSHASFSPASCGRAGCHNYHDNSALNVAFLARHAAEPDLLARRAVLERALPAPRPAPDVRVPSGEPRDPERVARWHASAHAGAGVGCAECHDPRQRGFRRTPSDDPCVGCHAYEDRTFRSGKHGVRRAAGLSDLAPHAARRPMREAAPARLRCATCHDAHSVDTRRAAVEACLSCHDDAHSRAYLDSAHGRAWRAAAARGPRPDADAVTCATCHLLRVETEVDGRKRVAVDHRNTLTLRPPDRMAKRVCMGCHGLPFALASLLDERLVESNFSGRPARTAEAIAMVRALAGGPGADNGGTR